MGNWEKLPEIIFAAFGKLQIMGKARGSGGATLYYLQYMVVLKKTNKHILGMS